MESFLGSKKKTLSTFLPAHVVEKHKILLKCVKGVVMTIGIWIIWKKKFYPFNREKNFKK